MQKTERQPASSSVSSPAIEVIISLTLWLFSSTTTPEIVVAEEFNSCDRLSWVRHSRRRGEAPFE